MAGLGHSQETAPMPAPWTPVEPRPLQIQEAHSEYPRAQAIAQAQDRDRDRLPTVPAIGMEQFRGLPFQLIAGTDEQGQEYQSRAVPPTIQQLAESVQSDDQLQERIRQEHREQRGAETTIDFPPDPILSRDVYYGRSWPVLRMEVAPYYVAHGRLLFQQINTERYGWDFGVLQPLLSASVFFWDFVTLPYHVGTALCRPTDANLGWCLPGDPAPFMIYPPELSFSGTITEAAVILGLVAIFP
jgi:hypothetical protein